MRIPVLLLLFGLFNAAAYAQSADPSPEAIPGAESRIYKSVGDTTLLRLHVFQPTDTAASPRVGLIFFFGGGWTKGSVQQFVPHARYFAAHGFVTVVADYRVKSRHDVTPFACVADAKSAVRWVRGHAAEFNIAPDRIVVAGGSAGGHLAACTALVAGFNTPGDNLAISAVPDALVLFNPVLDMVKFFVNRRDNKKLLKKISAISPIDHVRPDAPPTLIFHGTGDKVVPITQAIDFCNAMRAQGNECTLIPFDGRNHGFFNANKGDGSDYRATLDEMDTFLSLKF